LRGASSQTAKVAANPAVGKELVQKSGCLNCHALDLPNQFKASPFNKIVANAPLQGCLSANAPAAPRFSFSESDRADLHAFLSSSDASHSPKIPDAEFAIRATTALRCTQCHTDAALPAPIALGGKLNPDWSVQFIAGKISEKPRPWLKARMPAFPAYATNIAAGLANLHGFPAHSSPAPAPNPDLIPTGEKLISATGGFSCVACHALGSSTVQLIVESPGVNLAYSGDRLLPDYFHRWLMNPLAIDPGTKMPAYFDAEGRSQLHEFFDGDAAKQIDAMWHYIHSLRSTK
jgi:mono/diheme cytochrome c family protein